jgi:two-component system, cell cycle sensor histidine kinase and response regulator CckA
MNATRMHELLFELSGDGILLHEFTTTRGRGHFLAANDAACRLLGYTAEELSHLTPFDLMAPGETRSVAGDAAELQRSGTLIHEKQLLAKNGRLVPVELSSRLFEDEGRTLALSVIRDLTERKLADEALRRSEALLRAFSDAIPDPIFLKDGQGRYLFVNPATLSVIGKPLEAVLGRTDREVHGDTAVAEAFLEDDRRIMTSGASEVVEETIPGPAGTRVYLTTKVPYRDLDGRIIGIIGNARNITERVRAEEALRESEQRFRALNERSSDIVIVTDEQGVITFASPLLSRVLGVTPAEVLGVSCFESVHPDDAERLRESFTHVSAHPGAVRSDELRVRRPGGAWALVRTETANLLDVPFVRGIVMNSRDLTEQRRAEEQFRQAQKLESIGRLAGGVAHDFNNLLTVILSCAESLNYDVGAGAPAQLEEIQEIRAAGRRAAELTRQLLAFARKQVIAPVPVDLNVVVRGSEKLLRRVLGEDVELVTRLEPEVWTVRCDPGQLDQVILNLAVNARDAMPDGGRLTIETANEQVGERLVAFHPFMRPGPYVRLTISDSGVGMTPEVKSKAFEPFFTTKPLGQGTGLGLATAFGIVKQSAGYILLESEEGRGTNLVVYLPRTLDAADPAPSTSTSTAASRGTETVLVVEDDPQVREVTVRSLRAGGYRVIVAGTGAEALAIESQEDGPLHLLITDVVMPGLGGPEVAGLLGRRRPDLRVLYISGYPQGTFARGGVLEPGIELLPKPFTRAALLERVRAVLDAPLTARP